MESSIKAPCRGESGKYLNLLFLLFMTMAKY